MAYAGCRWVLREEGAAWRWQARARDADVVLAEGWARSRAEGAACLARSMALLALSADAAPEALEPQLAA